MRMALEGGTSFVQCRYWLAGGVVNWFGLQLSPEVSFWGAFLGLLGPFKLSRVREVSFGGGSGDVVDLSSPVNVCI